MKKLIAFAAAAACLAFPLAASAAGSPNSQKMFNDYDHYLVVYTDATHRVYADPDTIERDPYSAGSLPVIRCTTYAETYKSPLTYPDMGNYKIADHIYQYDTAVGADQFGNALRFKMQNDYKGCYTPDGKPANERMPKDSQGNSNEAQSIYIALYRATQGTAY